MAERRRGQRGSNSKVQNETAKFGFVILRRTRVDGKGWPVKWYRLGHHYGGREQASLDSGCEVVERSIFNRASLVPDLRAEVIHVQVAQDR